MAKYKVWRVKKMRVYLVKISKMEGNIGENWWIEEGKWWYLGHLTSIFYFVNVGQRLNIGIFSEKIDIRSFILLVSFLLLLFFFKEKLSLLDFHDEEMQNWSWLQTCWIFMINSWRYLEISKFEEKKNPLFDGWKHINKMVGLHV
jgi:hypothetical protein